MTTQVREDARTVFMAVRQRFLRGDVDFLPEQLAADTGFDLPRTLAALVVLVDAGLMKAPHSKGLS